MIAKIQKQSTIYMISYATIAVALAGFMMYKKIKRKTFKQDDNGDDETTITLLQPVFLQAAIMAKSFPSENIDSVMSQRDRLMLYGLYKQAKMGDCDGSPPSRLRVVEHAKYDAWMKFKGMPQKYAIMQYVEVVQHFASRFENETGNNKISSKTTFGLIDDDMEDIVYDENNHDEKWDDSSDEEGDHDNVNSKHHQQQNNFMDNPIGIVKQSTLINAHNESEDAISTQNPSIMTISASNESKPTSMSILEAAMNGNIEILNQLIADKGSNNDAINEADDMGQTPLHYASDREHLDCVSTLLQNGANVNATDSDGISVLQTAVISGNANIVKLLLESGADPDLEDMDGETARSCALDDGNKEIIKLFV